MSCNTVTLTADSACEQARDAQVAIDELRELKRTAVRNKWHGITWWQRWFCMRSDYDIDMFNATHDHFFTYRACEQILEARLCDPEGLLFYTIDLEVIEDINCAHRELIKLRLKVQP